ncbi:MAG: hypothetical protein ACE5JU_15090 [Candidatus Binatia bacterium]
MRRALVGLDGVRKAKVSFRRRRAIVYYEASKVSVGEMVQAVGRVGFRAIEM